MLTNRPEFEEEDKPDDNETIEAANKEARDARAASEERSLAREDQAAERAEHSKISRNVSKRRGQFISKGIFAKENPGVKIGPEDIVWRKAKDKRKELEYAKVYPDKEDEKIDVAEEEAEEVGHVVAVDDGKLVLGEGHVA